MSIALRIGLILFLGSNIEDLINLGGSKMLKGKSVTKLWFILAAVMFYAIFKATGGATQAFAWVKAQITGK